MQDFELYNTIVNNPIYLSITVLLSVLVVYSALKKFIKWLIFALVCFVFYLGFLYISGDEQTVKDVNQGLEVVKDQVEKVVNDQIQNKLNE